MPLTKPMAEHLAALMHLLRPEWSHHGNMQILEDVAGRNEFDIVSAANRACADRTAETPAVLRNPNSPCWRERISETRSPRNPMPHEECGTHRGQFRLSCSGCHSEKLAPVVQLHGKATAADVKAALRLAKAENCSHGVRPDRCLLAHDSPEEVAAYHDAVQADRAELQAIRDEEAK